MFISKYEKEKLQQKVDDLSLLVTQATDRANRSEEKILELSSKLLSIEEVQMKHRLKVTEVINEFDEIEGLSDEVVAKITTCDSRIQGLENFFASRYRHYDDMDKELQSLSKTSKGATIDISGLTERLDKFIDRQNLCNSKFGEHIKTLFADQKMTRGILFGLKQDVTDNKKDFHKLCKIAVTRDDPVFVFEGEKNLPAKVVGKTRKIKSTKGIKAGPLVKTLEAPWGVKKDGSPRKRPGRPTLIKLEGAKNAQPVSV